MNSEKITQYYESTKIIAAKLLQNVQLLFLIVFIPAFTVIIAHFPTAWGLDESVHIARAYQVSEGNLYPDPLDGKYKYGGYLPDSLIAAMQEGRATEAQIRKDMPYYEAARHDGASLDTLKVLEDMPLNSRGRSLFIFGTTGPYTPIVYGPSALGFFIGRVMDMSVIQAVTLAKVFQALTYVIIVYSALGLIKRTRAKWIVFIVACLPASVFQVATINADVFTNLAIILYLSIIVRIFTLQRTMKTRDEVILYVSMGLVALTKPSYALALLLVFFIPRAAYGNERKMYVSKIISFAVASLLFLGVSIRGLIYSDTNALNFTQEQIANMSLSGQIWFILQYPSAALRALNNTIIELSNGWTHSLMSTVGNNIVGPPYPLIVLLSIAMIISSLYFVSMRKTQALALAVVSILSALAVIVILYGTVNEIGAGLILGVQGRYFIPIILMFMLAIGSIVRVKIKLTITQERILILMPVIIGLYGMIYVFGKAMY